MNPIEAMMAPLFEEVSDGVCAADAVGKILYMNPAAEALLDTTLSRSRGRTQCDLLCAHLATAAGPECASTCALRRPGPEKAVTFRGIHNKRSVYEWNENEFKRVEKSRHLRVRCLRMPTAAGGDEVHLTILEDASAELELERRREDWRNMVAHDLRNPLTVIYAAAKELQDADPGSELLEICIRHCRRMTALLDRYLDVAKLESGLMIVTTTRVPAAPLLRMCVNEQLPLAHEKGVTVELEASEDLAVTADADLLTRVLSNLLNNAVKFTPRGGQVAVKGERVGDLVVISFRDSGPGIAAEDLPALFDRYHQAAAGKQRQMKGTGLGLAFCREAVKAMNGTIGVESEPGNGSLFSLRFLPAGSLQH